MEPPFFLPPFLAPPVSIQIKRQKNKYNVITRKECNPESKIVKIMYIIMLTLQFFTLNNRWVESSQQFDRRLLVQLHNRVIQWILVLVQPA